MRSSSYFLCVLGAVVGFGSLPIAVALSEPNGPACSQEQETLRNCYGVKVYQQGTYVGEWKAGKKQGKGKFTYKSGDSYVGEFYDDKPHGYGVFAFSTGDLYEGEFRDGRRSGQFDVKYSNGDSFVGTYSSDMRSGRGSYKWSNGSQYIGFWSRGLPVDPQDLIEFRHVDASSTQELEIAFEFKGIYSSDGYLSKPDRLVYTGQNFNQVSDFLLCRRAIDQSQNSWSKNSYNSEYVFEAERRGFAPDMCWNILSQETANGSEKNQEKENSGVPKLSNGIICSGALSRSKSDWDQEALMLPFVSEAKRRHLTIEDCRVAVGFDVPILSTVPERELCRKSLNIQGSDWDRHSEYELFVKEAISRHFSVDSCRAILGFAKDDGVIVKADDRRKPMICSMALSSDANGWKKDNKYSYFVEEAIRRGLSIDDCRVEIGLVHRQSKTDNDSLQDSASLTYPYKNRDDAFICSAALLPNHSGWNESHGYRAFLSEAMRRGLTLTECLVVVGAFEAVVSESGVNHIDRRNKVNAHQADTNSGLVVKVPEKSAVVEPVLVSQDRRVALVIGNSKYRFASPLVNPQNDASAIASLLKKIGFEVLIGINLDKRQTEEAVVKFVDKASSADVSLFYYAGHGIQVSGENFIVPVDAKVEKPSAIDFELVNVSTVTKHMGGEKSVGIALLDACRDNPFTRSLSRALGTRSSQVCSGLAELRSDGGGLLVGFATAPGDVADDGVGTKNSPFTASLLKHLGSKGLEIELLMKRVKADVYDATKGKQQPWHSSALRTEVYLAGE
jgi:hypothetical protein